MHDLAFIFARFFVGPPVRVIRSLLSVLLAYAGAKLIAL